jgi:hypothetical protein
MLRLACAALLVAACVDPAPVETTAPAPLVGVDGSSDQADRNCNVVLRELLVDHGPVPTLSGTIEISEAAAAESLVPSLMYKDASHQTWSVVAGTPSQLTATPGFARFDVHIPTVQNAPLEVVPFIAMPEGGRLFDHNRNPGDVDNYTLASQDFAVWRDDTVCAPPAGPARARLVFDADWTEHREGILAAGGEVTIVYAQSRLDQCKQTRNGYEVWDLTAHVLFQPGGELLGASVRGGEATMTVPSDARQAIVWFESTSITGCHQWDSNYGDNYVFDGAVPPQWVGNASTLFTRDTSGDHCGGPDIRTGFAFDTWTRQRAAFTNLCFEVYQPGTTDHDDPDLWQKLDSELHWRVGGGPWNVTPVSFDRRTGNNARYAFDLRAIDPFRSYHCPEAVPAPAQDPQYVQLTVEYYPVVNGYELRPEPGAAFAGTFTDYASDSWRSQYCH